MLTYLRAYGFTLIICTVIGILIWMMTGDSLADSLVFSMCIGLFVHTFTLFGIKWTNGAAIYKIWIVAIPLGVLFGLTLGGLLTGVPWEDVVAGNSPLSSLVIAITATYVFYSYYSMNELQAQLRQQELEVVQSEKTLAETQLRLLQSQIEPHFLFNTLAHVVSLIEVDPARAELMLRKLTQFLRVSLKRSRSDYSTLQDEIDLLSDYLAIIQIRMQNRLEYKVSADLDASSIPFPPLLLQPIVENAIVHGLEPMETGGHVEVIGRLVDDLLVIIVTDTGVGLADATGSGIGIKNVRDRLDKLFDGKADLELTDVEPHGLRVTIKVPV